MAVKIENRGWTEGLKCLLKQYKSDKIYLLSVQNLDEI